LFGGRRGISTITWSVHLFCFCFALLTKTITGLRVLTQSLPDSASWARKNPLARFFSGAQERTRTSTPYGTPTSRVLVYQFQHLGITLQSVYEFWLFFKSKKPKWAFLFYSLTASSVSVFSGASSTTSSLLVLSGAVLIFLICRLISLAALSLM
jgi:hypothetical protein